MAFTADATARGVLSTIRRGDYSLAVARVNELSPRKRAKVVTLVRKGLDPDLLKIWSGYEDRIK